MFPKHPTRAQLILYAESILEGKGPIYSGIGRHIANCQQCRQEVEAIKTSLKFFNSRATTEPPKELTYEIIKNARDISQKRKFERSAFRYRKPVVTTICCLLIWGIIGYYTFLKSYLNYTHLSEERYEVGSMLSRSIEKTTSHQNSVNTSDDSSLWHQIEILTPAILPILSNADLKTYPYLKMVSLLDEEIEKAQKVLEKFPDDERVRKLIRNNIREKVELLKSIYKESVL